MSTITVNGARVMSAAFNMPYYGAWVADVVLADSTAISNPVSLVIGDLTLTGFVKRQASSTGSRSARIVGGYGGWGNTLPSKGYASPVGVLLSTVLIDAAKDCGERINVPASLDHVLGNNWGRERDKGERVLHLLTSGRWWIDSAGVTQITSRDASLIATPFTTASWSGGKGKFDIATESISSWLPGRTFTSATISGVQTISSVAVVADNDGKLRLTVLGTSGTTERIRDDIRAIIRSEIASLTYAGEWEYRITASAGLGLTTKVDCTPTASNMPALTQVPLAPGVGVVSPPLAGTACRVRFVNSDPSRPEVVSMAGTTEHLMTTEATCLLLYNTLVALCAAAGGGPLTAIVLQPLLGAAITTTLAAQAVPAPVGLTAQTIAAAAQLPGFATGTGPATTSAFFSAAIAALSTKTLDVSGSFPSIGIPNG